MANARQGREERSVAQRSLQFVSDSMEVARSKIPLQISLNIIEIGGDRLRKMSISSIFDEEILENCRFWEVQTSGFGLCIIYPNYLSCFKVVPEPGQWNCHHGNHTEINFQ